MDKGDKGGRNGRCSAGLSLTLLRVKVKGGDSVIFPHEESSDSNLCLCLDSFRSFILLNSPRCWLCNIQIGTGAVPCRSTDNPSFQLLFTWGGISEQPNLHSWSPKPLAFMLEQISSTIVSQESNSHA